jgi:phage tail sheath protein FI
MAAVFAHNDTVGEAWFAPAGLRRGRMVSPLAVEISPTPGERDLLYGDGNAINPIVNFAQDGITVWGQRTLQRNSSATDRVNVRRLLLMARRAVATSSAFFNFEQNDEFTWAEWKDMVEPFFASIKARRGLYEYLVVMDGSTVMSHHIDANQMPGQIFIKPTKTAEFIPIDFVLSATGASFGS